MIIIIFKIYWTKIEFSVLRDYSLDNKSQGRQSLSSNQKHGPESDTDSMAEYGDGETGKKLVKKKSNRNNNFFRWL